MIVKCPIFAANAYILVNLKPTKTTAVVQRFKQIQGPSCREFLGPYDIVAELEADTPEDITARLRNRIRPVYGVTNTVTCWGSRKHPIREEQ